MSTPCIFVVEDDRDILDAIQLILTDRGYEVVPIVSLQELTQAMAAKQPDLFLLDIWIGGSDGREIVKQLRREGERKVPIILVSANLSTPQIAKELKVEDFVLKPFDMEHLLQVVDKRLKKQGLV